MAKRLRPYWIYWGGNLRGGDYIWLQTLKRSDITPLPGGFQFWRWDWVRPEHAWLSKRGWVCYTADALPPHEKILTPPAPFEDIEYEEAPCAIPGCAC